MLLLHLSDSMNTSVLTSDAPIIGSIIGSVIGIGYYQPLFLVLVSVIYERCN